MKDGAGSHELSFLIFNFKLAKYVQMLTGNIQFVSVIVARAPTHHSEHRERKTVNNIYAIFVSIKHRLCNYKQFHENKLD